MMWLTSYFGNNTRGQRWEILNLHHIQTKSYICLHLPPKILFFRNNIPVLLFSLARKL